MQLEFRLRQWQVKPEANLLVSTAGSIQLDHRLMKLLVFLSHNAGRDLSKDEILQAVWGEGVHSEEVLTVAISSLRKILGDNARRPRFIKTLPRHGYRMLIAAAEPTSSSPRSLIEFLDERVGIRFLIISFIIILFLLVLLTKKHLH